MNNIRKRDLNFIKQLEKEYREGASLKELSLKYKTDCNYQFKKEGIKKRSKEELKHWKEQKRPGRIKLNWNCKKISNETEAYIAGIFYADGYNSKKSQFGIRLKYVDKDLVIKLKNYFSDKIKLQISKDQTSVSFVVSSSEACLNLYNIGCVCNKTNKELKIPVLDKTLIRHFIRGFFDGDGSIIKCNTKSGVFLRCNICSPTVKILEDFQKVLKEYDIVSFINKENRKGKLMHTPNGKSICTKDMYRLYIRRKADIQKFFDFLYKDATIFLERKFKVFIDNKDSLKYKKPRYANTEAS